MQCHEWNECLRKRLKLQMKSRIEMLQFCVEYEAVGYV